MSIRTKVAMVLLALVASTISILLIGIVGAGMGQVLEGIVNVNVSGFLVFVVGMSIILYMYLGFKYIMRKYIDKDDTDNKRCDIDKDTVHRIAPFAYFSLSQLKSIYGDDKFKSLLDRKDISFSKSNDGDIYVPVIDLSPDIGLGYTYNNTKIDTGDKRYFLTSIDINIDIELDTVCENAPLIYVSLSKLKSICCHNTLKSLLNKKHISFSELNNGNVYVPLSDLSSKVGVFYSYHKRKD